MNKYLIYYLILCFLDLVVLQVSAERIFTSIIEVNFWDCLIFSFLFALTGDSFLNRHRNFVTYYPNFSDKWLTFF